MNRMVEDFPMLNAFARGVDAPVNAMSSKV